MNQLRRSRMQNVVMVADDDIYIRQLIRKALSGMAEVVETGHGSEVMSTYEACVPNMLLLDIHLPQARGLDLIKPILKIDPSAFIIMLSADAVRDNIMSGLQSGAKGFIGKPFNKNTLLRDFHRCPSLKFSDAMLHGHP